MKEVTVKAPGTVANVVCGFDILGFALGEPLDTMTVRVTDTPGVTIINKDNYDLPTDAQKNVAGVALLAVLDAIKGDIKGFEIESTKVIKPGSGIGSSAASAAAAVVAANHLLGNRFTNAQLVDLAMYGEEIASGSRHADNIAPCIYGGFTLVRSHDPVDIIPIAAPPLHVTVLHPQIEIKTSEARGILKKKVAMKDAITQWANVAGLIAGLMQRDYDLISRSLTDVIVEPMRSTLIPQFKELKQASLDAGALGGGISGSGPSIFMLSRDEATANKVKQAIQSIYDKVDIDYHVYVTTISDQGVRIKT
ncbi:MAG: homoserine kinase [Bacteroidetes bacterium]|nr:homoserine kinase [Bacteroidota bacterium]